jgi:hypothetical protein
LGICDLAALVAPSFQGGLVNIVRGNWKSHPDKMQRHGESHGSKANETHLGVCRVCRRHGKLGTFGAEPNRSREKSVYETIEPRIKGLNKTIRAAVVNEMDEL